ncbi:MAG: HAMP domain-containing protein [Calditrichota bacterium]|jgi:HAMP domain-containing protein
MKKFLSLRIRIVFILLLGALVFSSITLFLTYTYINKTLTESLIEQGSIVAANIAEIAAEKLIEDDLVALRSTIEKYKYYSNIEYILIEDFNDEIKVDTYNGNIPNEIIMGHPQKEKMNEKQYTVELVNVYSLGIKSYDIKQPVKEGLLGFVRVGMRKSYVDAKIKETITYLSLVFLIGIFLAIILAIFIVTLQISRPIAHLTDMAYKISMGDFNKPIRVSVKNEIGILAEAIERMRVSLKSALDRLANK